MAHKPELRMLNIDQATPDQVEAVARISGPVVRVMEIFREMDPADIPMMLGIVVDNTLRVTPDPLDTWNIARSYCLHRMRDLQLVAVRQMIEEQGLPRGYLDAVMSDPDRLTSNIAAAEAQVVIDDANLPHELLVITLASISLAACAKHTRGDRPSIQQMITEIRNATLVGLRGITPPAGASTH